jgi:hypothetical protein
VGIELFVRFAEDAGGDGLGVGWDEAGSGAESPAGGGWMAAAVVVVIVVVAGGGEGLTAHSRCDR